jgi:hypothetical protein
MEQEYENFYDDIKESNGVLRITIPFRIAEVAGFKSGDRVKVLIKKESE